MAELYCLDANMLIEAWNGYYSPELCPSYWEVIQDLGKRDRIFLPHDVAQEIIRTQDELSKWLAEGFIPIRKNTQGSGLALRKIYAADERHERLVDNIKGRSLADPWVIAHAIETGACVVTKEKLTSEPDSKRIRIPDVCRNMRVRCITDFQFLRELSVSFSCQY
jgi:predicted nucleic acid-binding protein